MAKSKTNIITHGYHGKVGDQFVLRVRGNNSMLCSKPDRSNVVLTQNQVDQTRRFSGSVNYAKNALADPVKKAYYESRADKNVSAYNRAVADFLTKPWIDQIDAIDYRGHAGDKICIIASDNVKVNSVNVSIRSSADSELETGACIFDNQNMNWVYTATTLQNPIAGLKVVAIVRDMWLRNR